MNWGFLPAPHHETRLNAAESAASRASHKVDRYAAEITRLGRSIEHLSIACQAMWELLQETSGLTEEQLDARMQEIDLRDGTPDDRITKKPIDCTACGAKSNSRRTHCVMCGAELEGKHPFDA